MAKIKAKELMIMFTDLQVAFLGCDGLHRIHVLALVIQFLKVVRKVYQIPVHKIDKRNKILRWYFLRRFVVIQVRKLHVP